MRILLFVMPFLVITYGGHAQMYAHTFRPLDSLSSSYFYPESKIRIQHLVDGYGNLVKKRDSLNKMNVLCRPWNLDNAGEEAYIEKSKKSKENFTVIVDTSLYSERILHFYKSDSDKRLSTQYRNHIKVKDCFGNLEVGTFDKDTIVHFLTQPVLIANLSDSVQYLISNNRSLYLTQQAMNKRKKWVDIETNSYAGGCAVFNCVYVLNKHDYILGHVLKYKGDYATLLRIKLVVNERIFYSEPYAGSIDYLQIKNGKIY